MNGLQDLGLGIHVGNIVGVTTIKVRMSQDVGQHLDIAHDGQEVSTTR